LKRSVNELEGASNFPLKTYKMDDGRVKATSLSLPGKEFFGGDEEQAIRAARNHIEIEFGKTGIPQVPKWAAEFGAKVPDNDWTKD
jgi:hypothetical protein